MTTPDETRMAEAVEAAARAIVPHGINPDSPHGAKGEALWTFYADDARVAISAALPVLVEEIAEAVEAERERVTSISKLPGVDRTRVLLAMGVCRDIVRGFGRAEG